MDLASLLVRAQFRTVLVRKRTDIKCIAVAHILDQLVNKGHAVVTTVRSEESPKIRQAYPGKTAEELRSLSSRTSQILMPSTKLSRSLALR